MIQPDELIRKLPVEVGNSVISDTEKVWKILKASIDGDVNTVIQLITSCPELSFAQFNYAPPIHYAVREGHLEIVNLLLEAGAFDPAYRTYFFDDRLVTMAKDRNYNAIVKVLQNFISHPPAKFYKGDNGTIHYQRTKAEVEFEHAVDKGDLDTTKKMLEEHPQFARDNTFFWGEGILMMPAKEANFRMMELLLEYGANFPAVSKWPQAYYFERYDSTKFILEHGMSPDHSNHQHATILHFLAREGDIQKAALLIDQGASINVIDEEYLSTPLGIAAKYGNAEMVKLLSNAGADTQLSGADWSTPLEWSRKKGHRHIENLLNQDF